jgi:beta-lactam-binding protein with PASTA domain
VLVPKLVGMEEGDARNAILQAGFAVGSVTFKTSAEPLGTVVESIPVPGEAVVLPATVSLILSDGKGRRDSLPVFHLR